MLFLIIAALSFSRAMQRLFEQTWELHSLSVRNTFNGLLWVGGLALYLALSGAIHGQLGRGRLELTAALLAAPLTAVFLIWSGWVLSAQRIARRDLLPFAILGSALLALYSVGAAVYVPHLFSTYATRYGVIGAVFAMISALFCVMVIVVGAAAAGREVNDELDRIRRGQRPADDEVRREWDEITGPSAVALGDVARADPRTPPQTRREVSAVAVKRDPRRALLSLTSLRPYVPAKAVLQSAVMPESSFRTTGACSRTFPLPKSPANADK